MIIGAPDRKTFINISHSSFNLNNYVAGLWEGDGHVVLPSIKGPTQPQIGITISDKDIPFLVKLQQTIGGKVRILSNKNLLPIAAPKKVLLRLDISTFDSVANFIKIVNGHLRTPKIQKFNEIVTWYNENTQYKFSIYEVNLSNLLTDSWLSGFIEKDGNFDIRVSPDAASEGTIQNRVSARIRLEQRITDPFSKLSNEPIIKIIATALGTTLTISTHNEGIKYYCIAASSTKARAIIVAYLTNYPLFSSKYLNYKDWLACHNLILQKSHTTKEGRAKSLDLQSNLINKRSVYNWDHLNNFYT